MGKPSAKGEEAVAGPGYFGRAPEFDGTTDGYKTWRKKVEIYAARARGRTQEASVGLELMQGLTGRAWEVVEDIPVDEI